ncbi:hypothetical protein AOQ84DRAFT_378316 [Glonium stellatum]|uniref:Uncharacterized protein n=1 Tax=Glonium stellatum TaxID=574774 RepID=A0A8E2JRS9_9PEZI|nr:hypothetical protein AOQ84DRAFT_378316 [Glonium stellatum]
MVNKSRLKIIKTRPIEQGLNAFYSTFNLDYKDLGISNFFGALHYNIALDLIHAL